MLGCLRLLTFNKYLKYLKRRDLKLHTYVLTINKLKDVMIFS